MKRSVLPRLFVVFVSLSWFARAETAPPAGPAAIDFTCAGFAAGAADLPAGLPVLRVARLEGDNTARLQGALDAAAAMPGDGPRVVWLEPGDFIVEGQLRMPRGGVVLRGSRDAGGAPVSVLRATGTDRRALLRLGATAEPALAAPVAVTDELVAAGARELTLADVTRLAPGDRVVVRRPSTKEWIEHLGVNLPGGNFPNQRTHWLPGSRDLVWDRTVVAVDAATRRVTLDAPLTTALERRFGGGTVAKLAAGSAPPRQLGVEYLVLESGHDTSRPTDEEHAWTGVQLDCVEDAWVRGVVFRHFVGSAVRTGPRARRVTVAECRAERPVSELGGYRRQTFLVEGQQVLVRDCTGEEGLNDFALGLGAAGPNVFRDCTARRALGWSGSFESWASGALYERVTVEGAALRLARDETISQGAGWTAANCIVRDCRATEIVAAGPADAPVVIEVAATVSASDGVRPVAAATAVPPPPSLVPPPELASFDGAAPDPTPAPRRRLRIVNGRFVVDGRVVWGGQFNAAWWKGQASPAVAAESAGRSITRFVPGREGRGLTENLAQLADDMVAAGAPFYAGGPGLWYDRRRDDHVFTARPDGRVWAPFYELPWARSGQGTAWDGLSRYDLSRFNPWYFSRIEAFARECETHGTVFYANLYNTHNVLETQAHWVDFPWRPANNVNDTGLPEPAPLDEKNAVHLADRFYDVATTERRNLHSAFIGRHLQAFANSTNTVLCVGFQFAGPRAFQEFFLDEVAEYGAMTSRRFFLALATSKDITDAILADPRRAAMIAVIDTRYWQTQSDGTLWAPRGDANLAFREQNAQLFGKGVDTPPDTTALRVYRGVREYRDRFPDKAIVAWHGGAGPIPVLMAGGAQALRRNPAAGQSQGTANDAAPIDAFVREKLAGLLMTMAPRDGWLAEPERNWCLADDAGRNVLLYSVDGPSLTLARDLTAAGRAAEWFDPRTGRTQPAVLAARTAGTTIAKPTAEDWLLFLTVR